MIKNKLIEFRFAIMANHDLPMVVALEKVSHPFPWSEKNFLDCIENAYWNYVLVENDSNHSLGHCIVMPGVEELHLLNITIGPQYRRSQIASRALRALEETALSKGYHRILLEVRRSNAAAIALYEKLAYQLIGARKNYYPADHHGVNTREDALVMEKVLKIV
jgi:[ribosomal protein S18]-alanine N-acetyltransferase